MNAHKLTLAVLTGLSLASSAALAQQAAPKQPAAAGDMKAAIEDKFRQLDADGDGVVSQKEAEKMKGLPERFQAADKNQDGKLDQGEFASALGGA